MAGKNAIARRLDRLHDQWVEFSLLPEPRLLRWLVRPDEYRVLEAFLQKESDDAAGELPDLFLRFTDAFEDVSSYGHALRQSLEAQYAVARAELEAEGLPAEWQPEPVPSGTHSLTSFLAAVLSLHRHYADELEQLVLVLTPTRTSDVAQWQRWLLAAARGLPGSIRMIVTDEPERDELAALAAEGGPLVHTVAASLDMPAAVVELAQGADTGSPGGQFRVQFAALAQALGRGDQASADRAGAGALAIAQEHDWPHLEGAVHFALAAGLLSTGRPLEAVARYRQVDAAGQKLEAAGDAVGAKLRLQAAFATGAAYVAAGAWPEAAATYESAAPLAAATAEPLMTLDAWRMAGYCHEQRADVARAWECGQQALQVGETIPAEQRPLSMLPYAGEGLLRIAAASPSHSAAVHQRMTALLGTPDWRPREPGGPE